MSRSEVFIGRQPVLSSDMNLFAYELWFHQGLNPNGHSVPATEVLIDKIQNDIGFQAIVGSHPSILKLPKSLLKPESIPQFESDHRVILELETDVLNDAETLKNLKALKLKGYHFLLDDCKADTASEKLSTITEYAKIRVNRFSDSEIELRKLVERLQKQGIKVIADMVQNEDQYHHLKQFGFDYFLGYFFTNPTIVNGHKLSGNKLNLLQLMAKVNAPHSDFDELTDILSQDVGLSHKLLMAINHPANDVPVRVEKISDGLKYMGLKRLKFWVNLLMLSNMEDVPQELLTTSLLNAKFCELMALQSGHEHEKDSYFLVGLLFNLDAYFKIPMNEVAMSLPLTPELKEALTQRTGPMGQVLNILSVMQNQTQDAEILEFEGLKIDRISTNFISASAWAQEALMA
ncbi:MAG: EAL domain-containing protein [Thiomicrorhabdus chilensis]|uniref:EAL and HDOD domain-containing protein n=1 Tax=Thiomicrorhabdus chilensis TaxID=63656 RepID=UPI00299CEE88|nr:EAL domain-containing protein [Thiomicrorhabdus chilensis]MDX1347869.1 EAL domain-containing protein [Thiomicrorhabdus chilensis]